jgi:2,3-bisphosphoglycerate-independent phosphoglycerate mutase
MADPNGPVVLIILDGWGCSSDKAGNAIAAARKPNWDRLWSDCPHARLDGSGISVGLPGGQMGNSEVGHLNLGAGRVIYQDSTRISHAIETGGFATNPALTGAVDAAVEHGGRVHVLGLLSPGGVHSHEEHIHAMIRLAAERGAREILLHAILDGRDMPPRSAAASLEKAEAVLAETGRGRIASVVGRYYAMDRDNRWERVRAAWNLIALGEAGHTAATAMQALEAAYARGEDDEFVAATRIAPAGGEADGMADGDAAVFMNFRADRARELTRAFIEPGFDGFGRSRVPQLSAFVTLTRYQADFDCPVAFAPERPRNGLGEYLASLHRKQLRIAETEKYAHVTFFFNGGREEPFAGEDRMLVPSPHVATYDLKPEMSAPEVTDRLVAAIREGGYDFILCNYANADMVGHTGRFDAAVKAIEALDVCLGRVAEAVREAGGEMLMTADHGNAEKMADESTGQAHTAHTTNLVPLVYLGRPARLEDGVLADVAPTVLALMGLEQPAEMSGHSLVRFGEA